MADFYQLENAIGTIEFEVLLLCVDFLADSMHFLFEMERLHIEYLIAIGYLRVLSATFIVLSDENVHFMAFLLLITAFENLIHIIHLFLQQKVPVVAPYPPAFDDLVVLG